MKKITIFLITASLTLFCISNVFADERGFVGVCPKCNGTITKNVTRVKTGNIEYRNGAKYIEYGITVVLDCSKCDYHSTTSYTEFIKE